VKKRKRTGIGWGWVRGEIGQFRRGIQAPQKVKTGVRAKERKRRELTLMGEKRKREGKRDLQVSLALDMQMDLAD